MPNVLPVEVDGRTLRVDGRDCAAWARRPWAGSPEGDWRVTAEQYVTAHPRAPGGTAEAQRLAILRRLAAGPAATTELLAAMRSAGWVGAADFENRLRDLRAADSRAAGRTGLKVASSGERHRLTEPFPDLDEPDRRALGFAKSMIDRLDGPLATRASTALERVLPGVAAVRADPRPRYKATPRDFERFHSAMQERAPVRIRYFSLNRGVEAGYDVVPVEYVTLGATVKALCKRVDELGDVHAELQFALDRLVSVTALPGWPRPSAEALTLQRSRLVLHVTDPLYRVMHDRNLFGIADSACAAQSDEDDSWAVAGSFPLALAWDVMEQLCAWAGSAQVREPYWLVNAVVRRLRAGLAVLQDGAPFELVKPEVTRTFTSLGDALATEAPLPPPSAPRKIVPPPRRS